MSADPHSIRPDVNLFPKRRANDDGQGATRSWLISFTDLIALLLSFFVMLYSTRDPAPEEFKRFIVAPIAPIVTTMPIQEQAPPKTLAKPKIGLDLNYIAALLRQAEGRDVALSGIMIAPYDYSLAVTLARADQLGPLLEKMSLYRRTLAVFGNEAALAPFYGNDARNTVRFFPVTNRATPLILIY